MARRPDDGTEGGAERRPTNLLGSQGGSQGTPPSGGQPSSGNRPPAPPTPPASKPEDKVDVVGNLLKQVNDKNTEIGNLCVEIADFRQRLIDVSHHLAETKDEAHELEGRRANLAKALSEVQVELAQTKVALTASNDERNRALADAKSARQFHDDALKYAAEVGNLRVSLETLRKELATANEQATKANEAVQAEATKAAAAIAKAKKDAEEATKAAAAIVKAEAREFESRISGLETDLKIVEAQRDEAWKKLCDAYAAGFGRNAELEAEVETLKQQLAEAATAIAQAKTTAEEATKAAEELEAKRLAAGADNGDIRQPTRTQMAVVVPVDKPGRIKRFFGKMKRKKFGQDEEEI